MRTAYGAWKCANCFLRGTKSHLNEVFATRFGRDIVECLKWNLLSDNGDGRVLMDFCLSFILDFDNQVKAYNCLSLGDKTRQDPWSVEEKS